MSLILKQLYAFIKLLNSDTGQNSLAIGLALGIIFGFSPMLSLQTLIIFLIAIFFHVQLGAAMLSGFFFKLIAFLFDPLADTIGRYFLELPSLRPLFVQMYNMPLIPFTRFNNSIVMGSGILAFILAPIAFFVFRYLIIKYREIILSRFKDSKIFKAMAATKLYQWYSTYESLYGKH
jgi:uncharacterized protein (TIGR03546 family)